MPTFSERINDLDRLLTKTQGRQAVSDFGENELARYQLAAFYIQTAFERFCLGVPLISRIDQGKNIGRIQKDGRRFSHQTAPLASAERTRCGVGINHSLPCR